MSLHGLLSVTIGVPNVEETAAYYAEFGLTAQAGGPFGKEIFSLTAKKAADSGVPAG
jgi:hypothetical protein